MSSEDNVLDGREDPSHETPQAITITIMDPTALETTTLDSTLVTSVQSQDDGQGMSTLLVVPGEGHGSVDIKHSAKDILQTVTEKHMGTQELPVISSISNTEESEHSIQVTTKLHDGDSEGVGVSVGGMQEEEEGEDGEDGGEPLGQHCLICNFEMTSPESEKPIPFFKAQTSTTQRKMSVFLGILVGQRLTSRKAHSDIMCSRCFNLLDRVDALEVEIRDTREEIITKYQETVTAYGGRARRRKPAIAKKTDYVFPKVEPEDDILGLEMDKNFEPQMEDLMEEEQDHREDRSIQDEEWEPEFKRPKIKREISEPDPNAPPKKKRGRPRKDASRSKTGPVQRSELLASRGIPLPPPHTRRVITVPASFRKCPHCPTIFMDAAQLAAHLASRHRDHQKERICQRCRRRFLTYEDNTACDPCLATLRQSALPTRKGDSAASGIECVCGHCQQTFSSRVLAELHCLSTGHDLAKISCVQEPKEEQEEVSDGTLVSEMGKAAVVSDLKSDSSGAETAAVEAKRWSGKSRVTRKRRLTRRNQTTCEVCAKECGSVSSLYMHLRTEHPAMFPHECCVCGRRFSLEASARDHERRHAVGELQCPACPLRFTRMSHLHHHARQLHPDFNEFPCQYCGAVTPTVDALHSHVKVHHGDRLGLPADFTCEVCKATFHTGKALATHRSSRHPGTAECGICGAQVGSRYLKKHINAVHTKEKTHHCHECGQDFYSRTSLTGHQKRHHAPRKHLCEQCGKGYVNNVELQRHLKAHRNQRDFKCDICSRSFLKAVDLTYHRRSHTGERPHQCMLCPESFIRPLGLRKHMLKHTAARKGKRLRYSKKKIDELASSVITQDAATQDADAHATADVEALTPVGAENPPQPVHPAASELPLQVFPEGSGLVATTSLTQPEPRLQTTLQQLTPSNLQVQQLAVTDLDSSQLEGQLELSQVVEDLSSGELLEMGPDLLLETADEGEDGKESLGAEGQGRRSRGEQTAQPVQVIYVQFVEDAAGWKPEQQLQQLS